MDSKKSRISRIAVVSTGICSSTSMASFFSGAATSSNVSNTLSTRQVKNFDRRPHRRSSATCPTNAGLANAASASMSSPLAPSYAESAAGRFFRPTLDIRLLSSLSPSLSMKNIFWMAARYSSRVAAAVRLASSLASRRSRTACLKDRRCMASPATLQLFARSNSSSTPSSSSQCAMAQLCELSCLMKRSLLMSRSPNAWSDHTTYFPIVDMYMPTTHSTNLDIFSVGSPYAFIFDAHASRHGSVSWMLVKKSTTSVRNPNLSSSPSWDAESSVC
mmetsp:Transcript_8198/g.20631  ORF Transcript_8198/g.20631 Transcript_8198/m.20631 type:complete len:275 (+) Transcript_8198:623-1447(+)